MLSDRLAGLVDIALALATLRQETGRLTRLLTSIDMALDAAIEGTVQQLKWDVFTDAAIDVDTTSVAIGSGAGGRRLFESDYMASFAQACPAVTTEIASCVYGIREAVTRTRQQAIEQTAIAKLGFVSHWDLVFISHLVSDTMWEVPDVDRVSNMLWEVTNVDS